MEGRGRWRRKRGHCDEWVTVWRQTDEKKKTDRKKKYGAGKHKKKNKTHLKSQSDEHGGERVATGLPGWVMSVTQQALLRSALCLRAQADCNATGRLPCKCFLKFEILALFTHPSVGNLQSEKHTANGLLGPGAWSHSVYLSLTQFENNAIWHKRQVDEMSESFFFFFFFFLAL